MKRVIYTDNPIQGQNKYVLKEKYGAFGIYEEVCPTGYRVHQSWLITDGNNVTVICESYNNKCYEEILDMIDNYNGIGKFGIKGFIRDPWVIHPCGNADL